MAASVTPFTPSADIHSAASVNASLQRAKADLAVSGKSRAAAQDFEQIFINTMFQQMFTAMEGEGPFGGGPAVGVWRSLLTDEYAKSFVKSGGIGIADAVYGSLIAAQEARAR